MTRDEILQRLRERIANFAASHVQRDAAEDLAQEVLLILHEKYPHLDRMEDLAPLSMQIARFKIISLRRKSFRRGEYSQVSVEDLPLPDKRPDPAREIEKKLMLQRMESALAQLGDRCRELFRLKLQGHSFQEIQQRMNAQSVNTVYTWDLRCRKQMLELMGGSWEQER